MGRAALAAMPVVMVVASLLIMATTTAGSEVLEALAWTASRCEGMTGQCGSTSEEEFSVDSELSRRILATSGYISYRALKCGTTPCSVKGALYYNYRPRAQGNPYKRGCSAIARCKRS